MRGLFVVFLALIIAAPVAAQSGASSRDNPIPFGQSGRAGDWDLRMIAANPDAYDALASTERNLLGPLAGNVLVLVRFEATYVGHGIGNIGNSYLVNAVGPSAVAYDYQSYCSAYPDNEYSIPEVFPGGVVEVNYCFEVAESDVADLVVYFKLLGEDERVFFALPEEGAATPEASPSA